jgi:transcriptional regulator with XRE-family HTH domain
MLQTPEELRTGLGEAIRVRRIAQGWSQAEAATRAGMGLSTWKRMEAQGPGTVENLINAAVALRCEEGIERLFPPPAASSLDALLQRQAAATRPPRRRAPRRKTPS